MFFWNGARFNRARLGEPLSESAQRDAATFRAHLDTTFVADPGAGGIPLRLADVVDERVSGGMEQFSLFFHGPADRLLPQGTYVLEHAALGVLALFLVPVVGSNHERIVYQACFSRPAASPQSGSSRT